MGKQDLEPVDKIAHNQEEKENHMITTNGVEDEIYETPREQQSNLKREEKEIEDPGVWIVEEGRSFKHERREAGIRRNVFRL